MTGNVIAHNMIRGRVHVPHADCGGYNAPGILLFADFRFPGDLGASSASTASRGTRSPPGRRVIVAAPRPRS